jgi:ribosome-associated toxin RatA of RatAB toxin-antitoxin module
MKPIRANDCHTVPFKVAEVFQAVLDFSSYSRWWPPQLRMRVLRTTTDFVGSQVEVRPRGGRFVCEIAQVIPEREIVIRYVDGLHRGLGTWSFEEQSEGTRICYQIDLELQGWLLRSLSHVMDFGRLHSQQMEGVFDGLESWLAKTSR